MNEFMVTLHEWFAKLLVDWEYGLGALLDRSVTILDHTYTVLDILAFRPVWDMIEHLADAFG